MNWYFEDTVLQSLSTVKIQQYHLHHTLAFAVGRSNPDLRWRSRARKIASIHECGRAPDGCQEECLCGGVSWHGSDPSAGRNGQLSSRSGSVIPFVPFA